METLTFTYAWSSSQGNELPMQSGTTDAIFTVKHMQKKREHRRRSVVNKTFCPKIYAWKINIIPKFYIFVRKKLTKCPNFTRFLPENIFSQFLRGQLPPSAIAHITPVYACEQEWIRETVLWCLRLLKFDVSSNLANHMAAAVTVDISCIVSEILDMEMTT